MSNTQIRLSHDDGNNTGFLTYSAKMAVTNYTRCDTLIPGDQLAKQIHYKVNLSSTIVVGKNLTLCDGGADR